MVREQLAFALNRLGRRDEAEAALKELIAERGPSSETNGLLGRVYKDRWEASASTGEVIRARGYLRKAIEAYRAGFESDWRDAYPGVNAVTLMELEEPVNPEQARLLPVVRYAVERRLATATADYWDHATLLELGVFAWITMQPGRRSPMRWLLSGSPGSRRQPAQHSSDPRSASQRGSDTGWIAEIEDELKRGAATH